MVSLASSREKYLTLEPHLARILRSALKKLKKTSAEVEVYLVSDNEIRTLNRTYRHKDKVTNVLSFEALASFPHPNTKRKPLGEIYLAPDYIKRKREDLAFMALHGLLHLLGYDHLTKRDRIEMEKREEALCQVVKIRPTAGGSK